MFFLRKLSSTPSRLIGQAIRWNATLTSIPQSSLPPSSSESAPTEPDKTKGRRRKKIPPKRPNISLANQRVWNKPLGLGTVPAYDLALQEISTDSDNLKAQLGVLRAEIEEKETGYNVLEKEITALPEEERLRREEELDLLDDEIERMMKKANIVEIQSEVNIPEVRWNVNNAMADMSKLSHRHLVEQKWRKDGDLDLLMERLYQMHVVPDALPDIRPSVDLHVVARTTPAVFLESKKVQAQVIPGTFLRPKQTLVPPKLRVNVFHTDVRLYTMLLVDLDVPHPEYQRFTTFLHWMKPNIPLSATSSNHLTKLNDHTRYIPPHPHRGSPYHRYVILLLPQPPISKYSLTTAARASGPTTSVHLDIPVIPDEIRHGFDIREFASSWGLHAANGGGAHMWREIWDDDVSMIYKDILKKDEPRYGRPPKVDVYAELKHRKKYTL